MEWDADEADAGDLIDRRGGGASGGALGGGMGAILGGLLAGRGRKGGMFGTLLVLAAVIVLPRLLSGGGFDISTAGLDRLPDLGSGGQLPGIGDAGDASLPAGDPDPELTTFANVLITDTNDIWQEQFAAAGRPYDRAPLVLFDGSVSSGCGSATAAVGPFYCPADERVYIDLSFFDQLAGRFGAGGDFAQAYVIAHEVGHHVQNELGIMAQVRRLEQEDPDASEGADGLSVRTELQADCLAGVWAHSRYERGQADPSKRLDDGDIAEALRAAEGVGDDSIQRSATGRVDPDSFTHGTSEQRRRWFTRGYDSGDSRRCDAFSADSL